MKRSHTDDEIQELQEEIKKIKAELKAAKKEKKGKKEQVTEPEVKTETKEEIKTEEVQEPLKRSLKETLEASKSEEANQLRNQREKYIQAYVGKRFESIKTEKFSIGVFFLGPLWYLLYKLYTGAILYTGSVGGFIVLCHVLRINSGMNEILELLFIIVEILIALAIHCHFCKSFYVEYFERANKKADEICLITQDEEERLRLCKEAGKVNLVFLTIILIVLVLVSQAIIAFLITAKRDSERMKRDALREIAYEYADSIKSKIYDESIIPEDSSQVTSGEGYYVLIDEDILSKEYPISMLLFASKRNSVKGYALIEHKRGLKTYICIMDKKNKMKYSSIIPYSSEDTTFAKIKESEKGQCDFKEDIPSDYGAKKLILKNP